jgi:hypothetical protein
MQLDHPRWQDDDAGEAERRGPTATKAHSGASKASPRAPTGRPPASLRSSRLDYGQIFGGHRELPNLAAFVVVVRAHGDEHQLAAVDADMDGSEEALVNVESEMDGEWADVTDEEVLDDIGDEAKDRLTDRGYIEYS